MYMTRIAIAVALCASTASADVVCGPRDEVTAKLRSAFGETPTGRGTKGPKAMMEVWRSTKTGSWTVVMSYTDGRSCIVAAGNDWTPVTDTAAGDPA